MYSKWVKREKKIKSKITLFMRSSIERVVERSNDRVSQHEA
jgi:hypothetical protein